MQVIKVAREFVVSVHPFGKVLGGFSCLVVVIFFHSLGLCKVDEF